MALVSYAVIVAAWWAASVFLTPDVLPGPKAVAEGIWGIAERPALRQQVGLTLARTLSGLSAGAAVAMIFVFAAYYFRPARAFFLRVIYPVSRGVPVIAVALVAALWFGLGSGGVVFIIVVAVLPLYLVELWEGLKLVDATLLEMARAISRRERLLLPKVILPMLVPRFYAATKLGFSVAFKVALIGEILAATNGMGFMMNLANAEQQFYLVFSWTLILMGFVLIMERLVFDTIERRFLVRWAGG
ncbi:MAG: ABC transporter permease subunit [Betaproteobacteria bacterium]|nr:MAG: ABC transporter permease subunit [Betaproteobacteria bacterium]